MLPFRFGNQDINHLPGPSRHPDFTICVALVRAAVGKPLVQCDHQIKRDFWQRMFHRYRAIPFRAHLDGHRMNDAGQVVVRDSPQLLPQEFQYRPPKGRQHRALQ